VTHIYIKPASNQCSLPHAKRPPHERLRPNGIRGSLAPQPSSRSGWVVDKPEVIQVGPISNDGVYARRTFQITVANRVYQHLSE
jgi:hypothetical protein